MLALRANKPLEFLQKLASLAKTGIFSRLLGLVRMCAPAQMVELGRQTLTMEKLERAIIPFTIC